MKSQEFAEALNGPDAEEILTKFGQYMEAFLRESGLDQEPIVKGFMAGQTAAQTMGLTRADLDALYAAAYASLTSGNMKVAEDLLTYLCLLDPLEARYRYCLGVIAQQCASPAQALEHFINFLALDATNADGYLRLGECYLALGNKTQAREAFEIAEAEAAKGNGDSTALDEARRNLSLLGMEAAK